VLVEHRRRSLLAPIISTAFTGAFRLAFRRPDSAKEERVARKTVLVCDNCGKEVDESKGAVMRVTYTDARRGAKQADLCDECAGTMPGQPAARRGRRPKSATA
jgi:ribosomal protein S26